MKEFYFLIKNWKLLIISSCSFLFLIILFSVAGVNSSTPMMISHLLSPPFSEEDHYVITSKFGTRLDPFTSEESFHSGIDLAAPKGTKIVASANGEVVRVGYQKNGLGNYVYLKHNLNKLNIYTIYGHLEDDSIVVKLGDLVSEKDILGVIGSTGRSTGIHLHYMVTVSKLSFDKKYLVDPIFIFEKPNH